MTLQRPKSMSELAYYTRRSIGEGKAEVWVFFEPCLECGDGVPHKPKLRASTYDCDCGAQIPKGEYEDSLVANVAYTCPHCKHEGELQIPFKRKRVQIYDEAKGKKVAAQALVFECEKCHEKINITKKMK